MNNIFKSILCKICRIRFSRKTPWQQVCSPECAIKLVNRENAKKVRKYIKVKREKLKTASDYNREAQTVFNAYIRLRDKALPCISCDRHHEGQYHAGHYRSRGSASHLRFNEDNVHKQCAPCNIYLSGNAINYRLGLIKKIGLARVEILERDNVLRKYTTEGLVELKKQYQLMIKALKND